jgi:5,10-methylene-tetrahydrofolate dehydrogenase/methenyl tetrahydrofolate cyclohydrolase
MDFDGEEVTETFGFNLSTAELAKFGLSKDNDVQSYFQKLMEEKDVEGLIALFEDMLMRSVGRRSEDGKRFVKNQDIVNDFMQTNAFETYFNEMMNNNQVMVDFFVNVVPQNLGKEMMVKLSEVEGSEVKLPEEYTQEELFAMSADQFDMVAGTDFRSMTPVQQLVAFKRKSVA